MAEFLTDWSDASKKIASAGVDRGMVYHRAYSPNGSTLGQFTRSFPWPGLISVTISPQSESTSYYYDGVKYLDWQDPTDLNVEIEAFGLPRLSDPNGTGGYGSLEGVNHDTGPFHNFNQNPLPFCFTYRQKEQDASGKVTEYIHFMECLTAEPVERVFGTISDEVEPEVIKVKARGLPLNTQGTGVTFFIQDATSPSAHFSVEITKLSAVRRKTLETYLYGGVDGVAGNRTTGVFLSRNNIYRVSQGQAVIEPLTS